MPNIAIIWDFDKTLTPEDSTSKVVDILGHVGGKKAFWDDIKDLTGKKDKPEWEQLLGSDAPAWMYSLSKLAAKQKLPLDAGFFREVVVPEIELFPNVLQFLWAVKDLEAQSNFKNLNIKIHHFVVSAGLKELVEQVFPEGLITATFGCRYKVVKNKTTKFENIPVFCMDETMKTRALFEISKGSFDDENKPVNKRVPQEERFAHFSDFIYIGDGPTDIPALSLTRYHGGMGVVVFNPEEAEEKTKARLEEMSLDKRADLITPADYSLEGELFNFIKTRCIQIKQRYEAENL